MSEIKTICIMCKKPLTAVEEYINLAVCLRCKRAYWGDNEWAKRRRK